MSKSISYVPIVMLFYLSLFVIEISKFFYNLPMQTQVILVYLMQTSSSDLQVTKNIKNFVYILELGLKVRVVHPPEIYYFKDQYAPKLICHQY